MEIQGATGLEQEYNIMQMQDLTKPEEIEFFNIEQALKVAKTLNLERLSPYLKQSRHIVICISGFLTENVEKKESWKHSINHFKYAEVYAFNWTSLSVENIFTEGHFEGKEFRKARYFLFLKTGYK
jgi:hypothetical protein